ncbi:MAG: thioredoxin family protein [Cyanobacteria bacterium P01_A01_bin.84]
MSILETINTPIGSYAPDFELPGIDNQVHHLSRYLEKYRAIAVISMCNRCPYVNKYIEQLKSIQDEFTEHGFTLIGMNGADATQNINENLENMKAFAQKHELNFPYTWDSTQDVTRSFGATKTPMAFLIDKEGVVRYKGKIDNKQLDTSSVTEYYLKDAIATLLQEKTISIQETLPIGTPLIWRS